MEIVRRSKERLIKTVYYIAPCKERNPVVLYRSDNGYGVKVCRECRQTATNRIEFQSPKGEVEGLFGSAYYCDRCVPSLDSPTTEEGYYAVFNRR